MKIEKSLLSGSTPLLVLSLLKDGDKYGYELAYAKETANITVRLYDASENC